MDDVLNMHFGVKSARDLLLRSLTLDIKNLTVQCENICAPFKMTLYTHVVGVGEVDNTMLLFLGFPLTMHFRKEEYGFDAVISCNKIFFDQYGFRPIFEGGDPKRKLHVQHNMDIEVRVDIASTISPR